MSDTPENEWVEEKAAEVHRLYCEQYLKDHGVPYRTNGDYSKLDERTKEYDRNIVRWHQKEITAAYHRCQEDMKRKAIEAVPELRILPKNCERPYPCFSCLEMQNANHIIKQTLESLQALKTD